MNALDVNKALKDIDTSSKLGRQVIQIDKLVILYFVFEICKNYEPYYLL